MEPMSLGIHELAIIAVILCVFLLAVVGGGGLVVWLITRKQRQDEP
ncbi:MAG: hypothetical protein JXB30_06435 [Anaerolineae bacterium]|nr:hypothetical protein [Anaerolineae bacterium]